MSENSKDLFRNALKKFKAEDTLFSSRLKQHESAAAVQKDALAKKLDRADRIATNCWKVVQSSSTTPVDYPELQISPSIDEQFNTLSNHLSALQKHRRELNQTKNQIRELEKEYQEALAHEKRALELLEHQRLEALRKQDAARKRQLVGSIILGVVVVCLVFVLHSSLMIRTVLTFSITIDGLLSPRDEATILFDEKPFVSTQAINPGHHRLSIKMAGVEPFQTNFWTFYGKHHLGVLPLESSKGALSVTVTPSPAKVILQQGDAVLHQGDSPLTLDKIPVGHYVVIGRRGAYEEKYPVEITRQKKTKINIELNLGSAKLSSIPPDAEFDLVGNGRKWNGKLPTQISDLSTGTFELSANRKGWIINRSVVVSRGKVSDVSVEFEYASIVATSEPSGLTLFTNGIEIGKTPLTIQELVPGKYTLTATDGENDLQVEMHLGAKEIIRHTFVFHYGTVALSSTPAGATVIRKGKEVGKTPLTLERMPAERTTIELRLEGYVSTNMPIVAQKGVKTNYAINLIQRRYVDAMSEARHALEMADSDPSSDRDPFEQARKSVATALKLNSADGEALDLQAEITRKADEWKKQKAASEQTANAATAKQQVDDLRKIPLLSPEDIIRICWNTSSSRSSSNSSDEFSGLSSVDAAKSNPAAVPVAAATDVVVKGIEGITWSVKKLGSIGKRSSTKARFDYERFNLYQNTHHRYYGRIAKIDGQSISVTFAPGGKSKQSYEVVARFAGQIPVAIAYMPQGSPIWISGRLVFIKENWDKNPSAANQLLLDDCTAYPADTLPPDK